MVLGISSRNGGAGRGGERTGGGRTVRSGRRGGKPGHAKRDDSAPELPDAEALKILSAAGLSVELPSTALKLLILIQGW